jgi:hypothetical protein
MQVLKRDGIIYIINGILFAIVYALKAPFFQFTIGLLVALLLVSYFLYPKQNYSGANIFKLKSYKITNVNGTILMFLFSINLLLSWEVLGWVEILYVITFCIIQWMITDIVKGKTY